MWEWEAKFKGVILGGPPWIQEMASMIPGAPPNSGYSYEFADPIHHTAAQALPWAQWKGRHLDASCWTDGEVAVIRDDQKEKKKSGSWSSVFFAAHSQRFRSPLQVTATSNQPTKAINAATSKAFASSDTSWKQIIDSSYVPPRNPYLDAEEFLVLPITIATLQFGFPAP